MRGQVEELPVIMILIAGTRVTVDNLPIEHDGNTPLAEVALQAVVNGPINRLGRPVKAVATDTTGTSMLVVDQFGQPSDVVRISEHQSTHFPELHQSAEQVPIAAPVETRVRAARSPLRPLSILVVAVVALVALVAAVINSGTTTPAQFGQPKTTAAAATPSRTPAPSPSVEAESLILPTITGVARQRPGGPLRLAITSSVSPLRVRVVLLAANGTEQAERSVLIRGAKTGKDGSTVLLFAKLAPRKYQWLLSATDAEDVSGIVQIRAALAPPSPSAAATITATPEVTAEVPSPASQPTRRPPSGPRDNNPIPPIPQP